MQLLWHVAADADRKVLASPTLLALLGIMLSQSFSLICKFTCFCIPREFPNCVETTVLFEVALFSL